MIEMAVINSRRRDWLVACTVYPNSSVSTISGALPVPERYPGHAKRLGRVKCDRDEPKLVRYMVGIVPNDSVIANNRVTCPCAIYRRLPSKRDSLANVNLSRPTKIACWQRDRVTVHCLRIVNELNVCRRTIGIVDRGPAARGETNAQKHG